MAIEPADAACRQSTASSGARIRWIGPVDRRDIRALDRWCASIGSIENEAPPQANAHAIDRLVVVSWNVHVGGGDVAELIRRLAAGELTAGVPVRDYALMLQEEYRAGDSVPTRTTSVSTAGATPRRIFETPPTGERSDVGDVARRFGLGYVYVPSMRNGRVGEGPPEDRGNAILSTLPFDDVAAIELPFERQRRVAIAAAVHGQLANGAGWGLTLVDAHLDASLSLTRGGPFAARRRQADALVDALRMVSGPSVVVAGDFNTWLGDEEPAIRHLRRAFPDAPAMRRQATWSAGVVGAMMDFVFARQAGREIEVRRLTERLGSDHYPLLAEIRF
jgi:endonuclease/exonuclease/phosphatase family metal-dependent hydrolase